jgi:WD40 repeat protein
MCDDEPGVLAVGTADGHLNVIDLGSGARRLSLAAHTSACRSVAISPNGTLLASGGSDRAWALWDADCGTELLRMQGHNGKGDCSCRLTGSEERHRRSGEAESCPVEGHSASIVAVAFAPCGTLVVRARVPRHPLCCSQLVALARSRP